MVEKMIKKEIHHFILYTHTITDIPLIQFIMYSSILKYHIEKKDNDHIGEQKIAH